MKPYYSMLVNLTNKECLVVGGGKVAERKVEALLNTSALLTVISPKFTARINSWVDEGRIRGIHKEYDTKDSENAFLIIAATNMEAVNLKIYQDAVERNQLMNIVDQPELSSFINPASFSQGRLQISVSTRGSSPLAAQQICHDLEQQYGEEYEVYLDFLNEYRTKVKERVQDAAQRQRLYKKMMQEDILHIIREGGFETFRTQALNKFGG